MSNRLFVGNLAIHVTKDLLEQHVATSGDVQSVDVIIDRLSGRPRGFAFVEMASAESPRSALVPRGPRGGREGGWDRGR